MHTCNSYEYDTFAVDSTGHGAELVGLVARAHLRGGGPAVGRREVGFGGVIASRTILLLPPRTTGLLIAHGRATTAFLFRWPFFFVTRGWSFGGCKSSAK